MRFIVCKRSVVLVEGGTGVEIWRSGATTPTQPNPLMQSQAVRQAPCGDTRGRRDPRITDTHSSHAHR